VAGWQQRLQIERAQLDLVALRRHDSRGACRHGWRRHTQGSLHLPSIEPTRLGLSTPVPDRRSAHALINASGVRFVHTF
jgi:hypothetical protein